MNKHSNFFIKKLLFFNIHLGSLRSEMHYNFKAFLFGFQGEFCIINPRSTFYYLTYSLQLLQKIHKEKKKILFLGSPTDLEKCFFSFCKEKNHYFLQKTSYGFFSNFGNKINKNILASFKPEKRPDIIFVFNPLKNKYALQELKPLGIPVMAFVNSNDDLSLIDLPIPGNINSKEGGVFVFKIFSEVFVDSSKNPFFSKDLLLPIKKKGKKR